MISPAKAQQEPTGSSETDQDRSSCIDESILSNKLELRNEPIILLVKDLISKLGNISSLPIENGSRVLLAYCTEQTLNSIQDTFKDIDTLAPRMFLERGKLYLDEFPLSGTHEAVRGSFDNSVFRYNESISGSSSHPLKYGGSSNYFLSNGSVQPDSQFEMRTDPPRRCPNLVFEVAVTQTLEALHHRCCRYLNESDNVLAVVGIKIFPVQDLDDPNVAMIALLYIRNPADPKAEVQNPVCAISFGRAMMSAAIAEEVLYVTHDAAVSGYVEGIVPLIPCDHQNIPQYLLVIGRNLVLAENLEGGVVAAEHAHAPDLIIDLFHLQRAL